MRKKRDLELQAPMRQERSYFPVDSRNVGACNAVKRKGIGFGARRLKCGH